MNDSDKDDYINSYIREKVPSTPLSKKLEKTPYKKPTTSEELEKILMKRIEEQKPNDFKTIINNHKDLLNQDILNKIFEKIYSQNKMVSSKFFIILSEIIEDPNMLFEIEIEKENKNEDENENIKKMVNIIKNQNETKNKIVQKISLLHLACELSIKKILENLLGKKIYLNVKYEDSSGQNALFYLRGENEDKEIIELLVKKGINMYYKDKSGNTVLHNAIINIKNKDLIYNLIDIGNLDLLFIKNNEEKSCLELLYLNWVSKYQIFFDENMENKEKKPIYNDEERNALIKLIRGKIFDNYIINSKNEIVLDNNNNENDNKLNYFYHELCLDLIEFRVSVAKESDKVINDINELSDQLIQSMRQSLKNGEQYEMMLFGSCRNGLYLPTSDIDLVIFPPRNTEIDADPLYILSEYLKNNLDEYEFIKEIYYRDKARVKIINIITKDKYNNKTIDISLGNQGNTGLKCAKYIKEQTKKYSIFNLLTLAFKNIFQLAKINKPYTEGLSSYGISILIIYILQRMAPQGEDISFTDLGKIFFEVLKFYSDINNINRTINVNENPNKNSHPSSAGENRLKIIDPLDNNNNVANNFKKFNIMMNVFSDSLNLINQNYESSLLKKNNDNAPNLLKLIFDSAKNHAIQ